MATAQHFLILRGLIRETRHWGVFPDTLRTRLGHGIHVLDLPGVGTEHRRDTPSTVPGIMEDLRARWLKLREANPGTWRIFAVSLGGMITQAWVAAHPDDFAGAVLCNSSAADLSAPWERMQPRVWGRAFRAVFASKDARERLVLSMTTHLPQERRESIAAAWARYAHEAPVTTRNGLTQLWAASRFPAPAQLAVPVLVLCSRGDDLCSPVCSERLAQRFNAPLKVHPAAGHDLPLEDGPWVAEQVAQWLHVPAAGAAGA